MMRFTVNLARRPSENLRRAWAVWGGMLAVLSAILFVLASGVVVSAWNNRRIHRQQSEIEHRMQPLRQRELQLDRQLQNPEVQAALTRSQYLNQLIDRKSVSWTRLFERLETLMPNDLELISIRPDRQAGKSGIVMVVGSSTLQPAITFISHLEAAPDFSAAQVLREGRNNNASEQQTQVRVEIEANYQPDLETATPEKTAAPRTKGESAQAAASAATREPAMMAGTAAARRTR